MMNIMRTRVLLIEQKWFNFCILCWPNNSTRVETLDCLDVNQSVFNILDSGAGWVFQGCLRNASTLNINKRNEEFDSIEQVSRFKRDWLIWK